VDHRNLKQWAFAGAVALSLCCAPSALAPPIERAHASAPASAEPAPGHSWRPFPIFGRSELRMLLSRRLKLVLDYRPIAYC